MARGRVCSLGLTCPSWVSRRKARRACAHSYRKVYGGSGRDANGVAERLFNRVVMAVTLLAGVQLLLDVNLILWALEWVV